MSSWSETINPLSIVTPPSPARYDNGVAVAVTSGASFSALTSIRRASNPVSVPSSTVNVTVRAARPAVNAAFLVPHGALRIEAMGWERRAPSDRELAVMKEHLAEGMAAGAVGLSTGLFYVPGAFAETEEIIELARVAAGLGGLYASHIRDEGAGLRINVLAGALHSRMTVEQLSRLDLAYMPAMSPVWDPLLVAANVALKG